MREIYQLSFLRSLPILEFKYRHSWDKIVNKVQQWHNDTLGYLQAGSVIARRYEIITKLGQGGAGTVYLCRETQNPDSKIAVKVLAAKLSDDSTLLSRFYREAKVSAKIQSPYIVRAFDLLMDDGLFAYTMEYVPGQDLKRLLESSPQLSIGLVYSLLLEISYALTEIHRNRLIHRDLKPSNVLITSNYRSKVTDFGVVHLAKKLHRSQSKESVPEKIVAQSIRSTKLTADGDFLGSFDYISPEYLESGHLDARADIYALGVLAFRMLTGKVPFDDTTSVRRLKNKVEQPAPELKSRVANISDEFNTLIMSCLEREVQKRPQSAWEFATRLTDIIMR